MDKKENNSHDLVGLLLWRLEVLLCIKILQQCLDIANVMQELALFIVIIFLAFLFFLNVRF